MIIDEQIESLEISQELKDFLLKHGYTNIGNIVPPDEQKFASLLSKKKFIELCVGICRFRSSVFWAEYNANNLEAYEQIRFDTKIQHKRHRIL